MSDAANMMAQGVAAQERYFLKRNAYTNKWSYLDIGVENKEGLFKNEDLSEGYYTKGTGPDNTGDGFAVDFEFDYYHQGFAVAQRVGSEKYTYKLVRPFGQGQLFCIPVSENEEDVNAPPRPGPSYWPRPTSGPAPALCCTFARQRWIIPPQ